MSDWTGIGTAITTTDGYYTFKDLIEEVQEVIPYASANEILIKLNQFLRHMDMTFTISELRSASGASAATFSFDEDIISVKEVYLDDVFIANIMTMEEYIESDYTSNVVCYIGNDRKIYFPNTVAKSVTVKLLADVTYDQQTARGKTSNISIPRKYFMALVYFVIKELLLKPKYRDGDLFVVYERKYKDTIKELMGKKEFIGSMNFGIEL